MVMSPEYPDLKYVAPRAYGLGRDGKAVRYIVIHYTAGAERSTSAEDGAAYDQRRTDGTSTHYFVDSDSVVQCVQTRNRGNAARHKGNRLGIQYELCGTAQTRAQWLDAASRATLQNAARQVARDCRKYDLPVRRLSAAETRRAWTEFPDGPRGIVGHVDCTNAYPEDGGDHTDPGRDFPWDVFLDLVRDELEDEMQLSDKISDPSYPQRDVGDVLKDLVHLRGWLIGEPKDSKVTPPSATSPLGQLLTMAKAFPGLVAAVQAVAAKDAVDEHALTEQLAPAVAAIVVQSLPQGSDPISQDEVTNAVKAAFRDAFTQAT